MSDLALSCDRYTYADYATWDETFRCELIDGVVYMKPTPDVWHQRALGEISCELYNLLKGKSCKPILGPFDIRLFPRKDGSDDTVVQADVIVVCDQGKLSDGKDEELRFMRVNGVISMQVAALQVTIELDV